MVIVCRFEIDELTLRAVNMYQGGDPAKAALRRDAKLFIESMVEAEFDSMRREVEKETPPDLGSAENAGTPVGMVRTNGQKRPAYSYRQITRGKKKGLVQVEIKKANGFRKITVPPDMLDLTYFETEGGENEID